MIILYICIFVLQGLPIILGSLAVLLCEKHSYHGVGDHNVWYGHVNGVSLAETS